MYLLTLWTLEAYFELENILSTHLLAWLCILVRLSEIQVYCFWELHLVPLDPLSWLRIACYFLVFSDILDGLEQRWCWARDWRLFRATPVDLWGFLSLSYGRLQLTTLVDCSWLEGSPYCVGCAAPAKGLALECQLARDPSSGCIATMRTSLPGSKWTSVKKIYVITCRGVSCNYDWFIAIYLLFNIGIRIFHLLISFVLYLFVYLV
jgi:hypothetical protein